MAMRMPPQVAQQSALPDINRTSLVFFGGFSLIVLNFYWANGPKIISAIFSRNFGGTANSAAGVYATGMWDALLQVLGLLILVGMAQYGGENAGTAALMFVGALWLLWLLAHFGTHPASEPITSNPTESNAPTSGGPGGQKK